MVQFANRVKNDHPPIPHQKNAESPFCKTKSWVSMAISNFIPTLPCIPTTRENLLRSYKYIKDDYDKQMMKYLLTTYYKLFMSLSGQVNMNYWHKRHRLQLI